MDCQQFRKIPDGSEACREVVWFHFESLLCVPSGSERILSDLRCSLVFLVVLSRSSSF